MMPRCFRLNTWCQIVGTALLLSTLSCAHPAYMDEECRPILSGIASPVNDVLRIAEVFPWEAPSLTIIVSSERGTHVLRAVSRLRCLEAANRVLREDEAAAVVSVFDAVFLPEPAKSVREPVDHGFTCKLLRGTSEPFDVVTRSGSGRIKDQTLAACEMMYFAASGMSLSSY
jgi:hypothetical protein